MASPSRGNKEQVECHKMPLPVYKHAAPKMATGPLLCFICEGLLNCALLTLNNIIHHHSHQHKLRHVHLSLTMDFY